MPTVCGSLAHSSNALPPLKSTSTNVRWSGSTQAARPATIDRSSSDLPAPVVPPTRAWGPSATKSMENTPCSATPTGVVGRGSGPAAFHRASTASGVHSSRSSRGSSRIVAGRPAPTRSSSGSSNRARARAQPRATSSAMPAGAISRMCVPACGRTRSATPPASVISTTAEHTAGSRSAVEATTTPATSPASPRSRLRVGARRPSVSDSSSTTTNSVGPTSRPPDGERSNRSRGPAALRRASTMAGRQVGVGATAADRRRWRRGCGAATWPSPRRARPRRRRGPSPAGRPARGGRPPGTRSERATASAAARSPTMPTTPPPDRSSGTAPPASVDASSSIVARASGVSAAFSADGSVTGARQGTSPTPARRCRKSASPGRRSHSATLGSSTRRTTSAGSGWASARRRRSSSAAAPSRSDSSDSSRANRSRSLRSDRRPLRLASMAPAMPMTGVSPANSRNWALPMTRYITPAKISGVITPMSDSGTLPWPVFGDSGRGMSGGGTGRAGRGGRLNGMVPGGAGLPAGVVAERAIVVVDRAHLELEGAEAQGRARRERDRSGDRLAVDPRAVVRLEVVDRDLAVRAQGERHVPARQRRVGQDDLAPRRPPHDHGAGPQREAAAGVEPVDHHQLVRRPARPPGRSPPAARAPRGATARSGHPRPRAARPRSGRGRGRPGARRSAAPVHPWDRGRERGRRPWPTGCSPVRRTRAGCRPR